MTRSQLHINRKILLLPLLNSNGTCNISYPIPGAFNSESNSFIK